MTAAVAFRESEMENKNSPEKLAYTVREFCQASGLSHTTAYQLLKDGKLRSAKVAGRRLISRESALRLLEIPAEAPSALVNQKKNPPESA